jgi:hypothetical protein
MIKLRIAHFFRSVYAKDTALNFDVDLPTVFIPLETANWNYPLHRLRQQVEPHFLHDDVSLTKFVFTHIVR